MITYELLGKLRLENTSLLTRVDQLRTRIEAEGNPTLMGEVKVLQGELHEYVCLVDAVVDALMPDKPRRVIGGA